MGFGFVLATLARAAGEGERVTAHLRLVSSGDAIVRPPTPVEQPSKRREALNVLAWLAVAVLFVALLSLLPE